MIIPSVKTTYHIVCPTCSGTGCVPPRMRQFSSALDICPACKGARVIVVVAEQA